MSEDREISIRRPGRLMAYQGKQGCESMLCRRLDAGAGACIGWHCGVCDEPSSQYGHERCQPKEES